MILFPNAKINIGLQVLRKRADGYHDLNTVFYPLPLHDALEILPVLEAGSPQFSASGLPIEGAAGSNLCHKAHEILKKDFPSLPSLQIHLHKAIPMGAGLGGGSSDGAFTLRLLNVLFHLQLSHSDLLRYALQLGSDCPFFISNIPSLASGRGEALSPIALDLSGYQVVLVYPAIHINTAWAFAQITPRDERAPLQNLIGLTPRKWKPIITNDFEVPVFRKFPQLSIIKEDLYKAGAVYASMTGSGSTIFGLFEPGSTPVYNFPPNYFVSSLTLPAPAGQPGQGH